MKKTYDIQIDAVKHDTNKDGDFKTTMHLALLGSPDERFLAKAYNLSKKKDSGRLVTFKLRIRDEDGKERTWNLVSKGSKSKDFRTVAVAETFFSAHNRFEAFLDPADPNKIELSLTVEIEEPNQPLFSPIDSDDDRDGGGRDFHA